jgi:hypothetical protein
MGKLLNLSAEETLSESKSLLRGKPTKTNNNKKIKRINKNWRKR